jgi:hypothetical protein
VLPQRRGLATQTVSGMVGLRSFNNGFFARINGHRVQRRPHRSHAETSSLQGLLVRVVSEVWDGGFKRTVRQACFGIVERVRLK